MKSYLVGTYTTGTPSHGLWRLTLNDEKTGFAAVEPVLSVDDPSWLCRRDRTLFVVSEHLRPGEDGQLLRFTRQDDGWYVPEGSASTGGENPCHAALSPDGKTLCVANYTGGSAAVFRTKDLRLLGFHQGRTHSIHPRQQSAHAHQAVFYRDGWLICDLGGDCIWHMKHDGSCREDFLRLPAGVGPRHAVLRENRLYVLTELTNELMTLDPESGRLLSRTSALGDPAADRSAAGLHLFRDRLYASNRGEDTVSVFSLENPDSPRKIGTYPAGGKSPRDFLVTEDGILCACTDGVTWLKQEGTGFRLADSAAIPAAVRILEE